MLNLDYKFGLQLLDFTAFGLGKTWTVIQIKDLTNYLSVRDLNTSGRKVELVARAFAAFGLKTNIIASSEDQKLKLESDYQEMFSKHGLVEQKKTKQKN